jgi:hypothetical protein
MWTTPGQRCVLIVGMGQFTVQITDGGDTVLRTQVMASADEGVALAISWGVEAGVEDKKYPPPSPSRENGAAMRRLRSA